MSVRPTGVIAPLITPLERDGTVSRADVRSLVDAIRPWTDGLMPCISCGEGWLLSTEQWHTVVDETLRSSRGLPVHAGCQARTWADMQLRARSAAGMGAATVVLSVPVAARTEPDEALLTRFARLREAAGVPVVFYWESFVCGRRVSPELAAKICSVLDAVAVKDSLRSRAATSDLRRLLSESVALLQGWEDLLGAEPAVDGYVGPLALLSDSVTAAFRGDLGWSDVHREAERSGVLEPDYVARVKAELCARGLIRSAAELPRGLS